MGDVAVSASAGHSRSIQCPACAASLDAYRADQWIRRDGRPEYSEREIFRFDRHVAGPCDLCGADGALGVTIDVWAIGSQRDGPADVVLELAICVPDVPAESWTPHDWRWLISGAYRDHRSTG